MTIRVFIADDHGLVRYALRTLLEGESDIDVVGEAEDGNGAIDGICELEPDVVLLDMRMPEADGIEVCRRVRERCPDVRLLVLTSFDDDDEVFGVLAVGASGYILKDTRPTGVVDAVRAVADGRAVFDSKVAGRVIAGQKNHIQEPVELADPLSERECEVLALMARGHSNKEIGRVLWISEATVKTHVSHILKKLGQSDRTQAVIAAIHTGLLQLSELAPADEV